MHQKSQKWHQYVEIILMNKRESQNVFLPEILFSAIFHNPMERSYCFLLRELMQCYIPVWPRNILHHCTTISKTFVTTIPINISHWPHLVKSNKDGKSQIFQNCSWDLPAGTSDVPRNKCCGQPPEHRPCTRTMERTITVRPAPYCYRACLWSQCCILLLATLEWGQWRHRWQQMESQKCPSRYKDLAAGNFLLGIWASKQLNLWTAPTVYLCLLVSSCQYPSVTRPH